MFSLRSIVFGSLALLFAAQSSGAVYCCPKTEDSLDHPPQNKDFKEVSKYEDVLVNPPDTDDQDTTNLPKETIFYCRYNDNVSCAFKKADGQIKWVFHSMCHTAAVQVADADAASNSYCPKS